MIWILIILVGYILPAYVNWRYMHIAHSKGGIWFGDELDFSDIIFVLFPFVNIASMLLLWGSEHPSKSHKKIWINKFFKIK